MHKSLTSRFVLLLLITFPLVFNYCGGKEEDKQIMEIVTTSPGRTTSQKGGTGVEKKSESIFKVFSAYKEALLAADGVEACNLVCAETIGWYSDSIKEALNLDRKELSQQDILKKFTIVRMRHEFPKKEVEQMSGKDMFILGVKKGWVGFASIPNTNLDRVEEKEDTAIGYMAAAPDTPAFFFIKENGQWKISLVGSFPLIIKTLKHYIDSKGMTEDEWIISTLNNLSSKKVNPKIFDGYIL
jgi:hypothetical protein